MVVVVGKNIANVYNFLDYKSILKDNFASRMTNNKNYSLRSYARDLSISPGFLSEILRGKKELRTTSAEKIFKYLGYDTNELRYIMNLILMNNSKDDHQKELAKNFVLKYFTGDVNSEINNNDDIDLTKKLSTIVKLP